MLNGEQISLRLQKGDYFFKIEKQALEMRGMPLLFYFCLFIYLKYFLFGYSPVFRQTALPVTQVCFCSSNLWLKTSLIAMFRVDENFFCVSVRNQKLPNRKFLNDIFRDRFFCSGDLMRSTISRSPKLETRISRDRSPMFCFFRQAMH